MSQHACTCSTLGVTMEKPQKLMMPDGSVCVDEKESQAQALSSQYSLQVAGYLSKDLPHCIG